MKKILVVLLALVLALSAFSAIAEEEVMEYDIRALIWKYDDTYGSSVRQAMNDAVEEINAEGDVKITLTMYDAADDMAKQVEQATMLVGEKPDFVIINLAEVASGQQLVDMFSEAGIPFLFYNKEPSEETVQSVIVDSGSIFIGTTPSEAGVMQGEILADIWAADTSIDLNGDGKLQFVEFMGEPNNPEAIARTEYSESTAVEMGVPLEAALEEYVIVANWDTAQAQEKMTPTWTATEGNVEVVFVNNDDMGTGVVAAMNAFGYNTGNEGDPSIVVIGVDATDSALEAIKAGKMTATVKQDGDAMGYANVAIALNYLQTGSWLEGTDYEYAEDGYSVRIPYAKITEVE